MKSTTTQYVIFVYGSLRDPAVCRRILGRRFERVPATLYGFRRTRRSGYAYPIAVRDNTTSIRGVLLLGLTKNDMRRLDAYEEIPRGPYRRRTVIIQVRKRRIKAFVYVEKKEVTENASVEPFSRF